MARADDPEALQISESWPSKLEIQRALPCIALPQMVKTGNSTSKPAPTQISLIVFRITQLYKNTLFPQSANPCEASHFAYLRQSSDLC